MTRPVIAILTDFGLRDHYAGTMKGVLLGACPDAALVDLSHDIEPGDVVGAALELAAAYRYFPPATVFLVVIDPGVGTARRGIAAEMGRYRFVAPDNGVLSVVLDETPSDQRGRIVELSATTQTTRPVSRTFEGRDRFAPAAARLACGASLDTLGDPATDYVRLSLPVPVVTESSIEGEIVRVDRFGNLISNIKRTMFDALSVRGGLRITLGALIIRRVVATYAEAAAGEVCALFSSSDHLEIAVNRGHAATALDAGRSTRLTVRLRDRAAVFVRVLNQSTEAWRPVDAEHVSGDRYRLLGDKPDDETWPFATGDVVRCRPRGPLGSQQLAAYEKSEDQD